MSIKNKRRMCVKILILTAAMLLFGQQQAGSSEVAKIENNQSTEHCELRQIGEPIAPETIINVYDTNLPQEYAVMLADACEEYGVEYELALAVMQQENPSHNPNTISKTNDYGLMQINIINHKNLYSIGFADMLDAEQNINAGVYMLSKCYAEDKHLMLMRYNMGYQGAANARKKGCKTTSYSRSVMDKYNRYKGE